MVPPVDDVATLRAWRALVALGAEGDAAWRIVDGKTGADEVVAAMLAEATETDLRVTSPHEDEAVATAVRELSVLPSRARVAIVAHGLGVLDAAALVAHGLEGDHAAGRAALADRGLLPDTVVEPLRDLVPAADSAGGSPWLWGAVAVGAIALCIAAVVGLTSRTPVAPPVDVTAAPTTIEHALPTPTPLEAAPTALPSEPSAPYVEPDRELEIVVSDAGTVVRLEPWTRRQIWESRPLGEPEIISVDPNTVTVESRGNRLVISLTDGTLLPP